MKQSPHAVEYFALLEELFPISGRLTPVGWEIVDKAYMQISVCVDGSRPNSQDVFTLVNLVNLAKGRIPA